LVFSSSPDTSMLSSRSRQVSSTPVVFMAIYSNKRKTYHMEGALLEPVEEGR
jgi:hypothetical protein